MLKKFEDYENVNEGKGFDKFNNEFLKLFRSHMNQLDILTEPLFDKYDNQLEKYILNKNIDFTVKKTNKSFFGKVSEFITRNSDSWGELIFYIRVGSILYSSDEIVINDIK